MLTVAYIGFGTSVRYYHLPYVCGRKNVKVKTIYRRENSINKKLEACYEDISFTSSLEDIENDPEINLVVIATPNQFHVSYGKQFLNVGKNVLIEKPIAPSVEEAKELYCLAEEKGLLVYTNMNRRYDGDYQTLQKVVKSGVVGEIVEIESHYDYFHPTAEPRIPYFYNMGIHGLDQMVHLFGEPQRIVPYVHSYNQIEWGCDFFDITMLYYNMRVSVSTSVFVKQQYPRYIVHGKKGSLIKYGTFHVDKTNVAEPVKAPFGIEPEENWAQLEYVDEYGNTVRQRIPTAVTDYGIVYDDIDAVVNEGKKPKQTQEEILAVLRIMDESVKNTV